MHQDQYKEVYGLLDQALKSLMESTLITTDFVPQQLSINKCDSKSLGRHPYITYKMGDKIVAYRNKNGPFHALDDLVKHQLVSTTTFEKVKLYLCLHLQEN